ncbi:PucR family transcriptional regulator [Austwickia chelonae]|uniref:PucR family transcriptional regulator n=1 Tax=Austwickia chelonae TaxID=100225 RepID=UPI000E23659C|nr:helix-turn-helix domain-containing protein [Austwickia chelonae]
MTSDSGATSASAFSDVLDALAAELDPLCDQVCSDIWSELGTYASVGRDPLDASIQRDLEIALAALRTGRPPTAATLAGAAQTATERFHAHVPVEDIVRAYRICNAAILERFVRMCTDYGVRPECTVQGMRVLWDVGDAFSSRVVTTYHALKLNAALRDSQQRASAARSLLAGRARAIDIAHYCLDPDAPYAAVRASVTAGADAEQLRHRLESSGSTPRSRAFVAIDNGICLGMVARTPDSGDIPVGIGPFVPLDELGTSDAVAVVALRVAQQIGRRGVQGVAELGWRMAASEHPEITQLYTDRYLTPVLAQGAYGEEMLSAVHAHLANGLSIRNTAEALHVHINTARYRINRFEESTGADLSDPHTLVELVWALELRGTASAPTIDSR